MNWWFKQERRCFIPTNLSRMTCIKWFMQDYVAIYDVWIYIVLHYIYILLYILYIINIYILYLLYNYIVCVQPPEPVSVFKIWSMGQVKHTRGMPKTGIPCSNLAAAALGQRQLHIVLLELAEMQPAVPRYQSRMLSKSISSLTHLKSWWLSVSRSAQAMFGPGNWPCGPQFIWCLELRNSNFGLQTIPGPHIHIHTYYIYYLIRWAMGLAIPG